MTREEFLQSAGVARMQFGGQDYDFRYPNNPYLRNVIQGIFQGKEYPIFNLPGFTPTTIVDIGANVGAAALYFHLTFPNAEMWCYEPTQQNYWCLEANLQPFTNVHVFPYGLLDRDCELPIYYGTSQSGQNSLTHSVETAPVSTETVKLVSARREALARQWQHISILKLDTEGCEIPILTELLAVVPSIDLLYCEYHAEEDRHTLNALTKDRFVLGYAHAEKPHQGMCIYWSRLLLERYPLFNNLGKSIVF